MQNTKEKKMIHEIYTPHKKIGVFDAGEMYGKVYATVILWHGNMVFHLE